MLIALNISAAAKCNFRDRHRDEFLKQVVPKHFENSSVVTQSNLNSVYKFLSSPKVAFVTNIGEKNFQKTGAHILSKIVECVDRRVLLLNFNILSV